ncbi:D-3-phosphoglycerate dehydrogenase [Natronorubrum tibetense GA33]|uniref:D-3-phosphoglycerate dehydrogenase n=1 Tax=Natronorubrum tibetense GA33 TaxID=1114856 RepID=L9VGS9_9EURY|nr:D-3-phosphoglycerate dehydrogenase [Natronorubrum tibetense GA33]
MAIHSALTDEIAVDFGEKGTLAGTALDVFAEEPLSADSPLLEHGNIIVTVHLGASTEAAQEMSKPRRP